MRPPQPSAAEADPAGAAASTAVERVEVLWVGSIGGMEAELVQRAGVAYHEIPAAGLHGVGLGRLPRNLAALARGFVAARRVLRSYQPDVLFFTGGYIAAPMALAGRQLPALLYVPDIEPGLALKTLARFADRIAVSAAESRQYFSPGADLAVTGYPVRADLLAWDRAEARRRLGLAPHLPVLLVFGGSYGARSINRALIDGLPELLTDLQVIHVTGIHDWPEAEARRAELQARLTGAAKLGLSERYHVFPYLHDEMGAAFAAADLAVCRAGASTLGELPAFGLPAILAPYPHAWRYQRVNADYLASRGAAIVIEDKDLGTQLVTEVHKLILDSRRLAEMRQAMQSLAHPQAAAEIGVMLSEMASRKARKKPEKKDVSS